MSSTLPQLDRALRLLERYAFVHSDAPFRSDTPVVGPLVVGVKGLARRLLRAGLRVGWGTQDEFNAAAAEVLVEFARRAPLAHTPRGDELEQALQALAASLEAQTPNAPPTREWVAVLEVLTREVAALREGVRAAALAAAAAERRAAELALEVERLKDKR